MQNLKFLLFPLFLVLSQLAWAAPVKILPLGDSITHGAGYNSQGNSSYRDELYDLLTDAGYNFEFVGTQSSDYNGHTLHHDGVSSIRADQIFNGGVVYGNTINNLQTKLSNYDIDIVLLHAGTNDIDQQPNTDSTTLAEIENIIDELQTKNSEVIVLVAKILPFKNPDRSTTLNGLLNSSWAESQSTDDSNVFIVDQHTNISSSDLTSDLVHPNQSGEDKMANKWFEVLVQQEILAGQFLPEANLELTAPSSTYEGSSFSVSSTSDSSGLISLGSDTQTICTINDSTVTAFTSGICTITGEQETDGNYQSDSDSINITITPKSDQTVTLNTLVSPTFIGNTFTLSASSTSGLDTFTYSTNTPIICSLIDNEVTPLSEGSCILFATQSGNSAYKAATSASKTVMVIKPNQTISLSVPSSPVNIGSTFSLTAISTSNLTDFTYTTATTNICSITTNTVTALSEGNCQLVATQQGNSTYNSATSPTMVVNIIKNDQTVILNTPDTASLGSLFTVNASASSSLDVDIISDTPNVCIVTNNQAKPLTAGVCKITAMQSGNDTFKPQTTAKTITITETEKAGGSISPLSLLVFIIASFYTRRRFSTE